MLSFPRRLRRITWLRFRIPDMKYSRTGCLALSSNLTIHAMILSTMITEIMAGISEERYRWISAFPFA